MAEALEAKHCCNGIRRGSSNALDTLGVAVALGRHKMKVAESPTRSPGRMSARGLSSTIG